MIEPTRDGTSAAREFVPLPGEICAQFIRCGKAGCRCEQGERHGPYYYRIWREGEKVHKVYVKRDELPEVQTACDAYRDYQQHLRDTRQERTRLCRAIRGEWRRTQRLVRKTSA